MVWLRTRDVGIAAALGRVDIGDRCGGATLAREPDLVRQKHTEISPPHVLV